MLILDNRSERCSAISSELESILGFLNAVFSSMILFISDLDRFLDVGGLYCSVREGKDGSDSSERGLTG
jgi:hypothetical protein